MALTDLTKKEIKKSSEEGIKPQLKAVDFTTRCLVTIGVLVVYCVLLILPIDEPRDPFDFMRVILRTITPPSMRLTLGVLGILPLMTTGVIMYTLVRVKVNKVDMDSQHIRNQYNNIRFLLSLLMTLGMAIFLIVSWYTGYDMDLGWQLGTICALTFAGSLIVILNEIINRGWGLGSGISIFITGSVSLRIIQGLFSTEIILEGSNHITSARGIVWAFLSWVREAGHNAAFENLLFRYSTTRAHNLDLPSLSIFSVILAGGVFCLIVFLENNYSQTSKNSTFEQSPDSVLTPVLALILTSAVFALVRTTCQYIWNTGGRESYTSVLVQIVGQYRLDYRIEQYVPVGGLAYFLSPPRLFLTDLLADPIPVLLQALVYGVFFVGVYMSVTRVFFKLSSLKLKVSEEREIQYRWLVIGGLSVISNLFNPLGIGMGIVLLALILVSYYQLIQGKGSPKFVRFDFESSAPLEMDRMERRQMVKDKFWRITGLIGLGLLVVWVFVSMIFS